MNTQILRVAIVVGVVLTATNARPQQAKNTPSPSQPRVYVGDSESWEMVGGWGMSGNRNANGSGSVSGGGYTAGGARPQTAEIIKTFNQRCPSVTVTNNVQKADFAVILDHEGGKGLVHRRNKIAVFNRDGDVIFSDSTRELGNSVKDACQAILSAPATSRQTSASLSSTQPSVALSGSPAKAEDLPQPNSAARIEVTSSPSGADIELDGNFVGNTPSSIDASTGDHAITIKKNGYKSWERKIKVSRGNVSISADLETEGKQTSSGSADETTNQTSRPQESGSAPPDRARLETATGTAQILGIVSLTSDPTGAEVYVDNSSLGKAPITLNLKPGQHYVRVFMKDYKNWSQQITVVSGSELKVAAKLEKSE